jgi:hypothetical protein
MVYAAHGSDGRGTAAIRRHRQRLGEVVGCGKGCECYGLVAVPLGVVERSSAPAAAVEPADKPIDRIAQHKQHRLADRDIRQSNRVRMKDNVEGAARVIRAQRMLQRVATSLSNVKKVRPHYSPIDIGISHG